MLWHAQTLFNSGADRLLQSKDDLLSSGEQTGLLRLRLYSIIQSIDRGLNESDRCDVGDSLP